MSVPLFHEFHNISLSYCPLGDDLTDRLLPGEICLDDGIFQNIGFNTLNIIGTVYLTNYRILFIPLAKELRKVCQVLLSTIFTSDSFSS